MLHPIDKARWDFGMAAHLLNRAGFGGTPDDIQKLVALGPKAAVLSLVNYEGIPDATVDPDWAKPDPDRAARLLAQRNATADQRKQMQQQENQQERQRMLELKHWWLLRMAYGPRPLQEKMTLFWHGHFATSEEKVRDAYLMWRQNELFRRQATGNWYKILDTMAKDPAMLVWLDQAQSRKEHPNENFAREVMELFTLGEGHYSEKDITEAARALTGWSYDRPTQEFILRPAFHDPGQKTVLGRTGNLNGDDVISVIANQPQSAFYITARLWTFFAGEPPSPDLNAMLATMFRDSGMNFKPLLSVIFQSEEFYSDAVVRNQVKSPVQWLVQAVRTLERQLPAPVVCLAITKSLGQDLFAPPNVKGWDGGLSWITTNSLLDRYNFAAFLVQGDLSVMRGLNLGGPNGGGNGAMQNRLDNLRPPLLDVNRILSDDDRGDKDKLIAALEHRLIQGKLRDQQNRVLRDYLDGQSTLTPDVVRNAVRLMMSTPEYQLT